jgi:hypothetical protein
MFHGYKLRSRNERKLLIFKEQDLQEGRYFLLDGTGFRPEALLLRHLINSKVGINLFNLEYCIYVV